MPRFFNPSPFTPAELEWAIAAHDDKDSPGAAMHGQWRDIPGPLKRLASKASYNRRRAAEAAAAGTSVDQLRAREERTRAARQAEADAAYLLRLHREEAALRALRRVGTERIVRMITTRLPLGLYAGRSRTSRLADKSSYLSIVDGDGFTVATIRISDHRMPEDGGYLMDTGRRAGAATASIDPTTYRGSVAATVDAAISKVIAEVG